MKMFPRAALAALFLLSACATVPAAAPVAPAPVAALANLGELKRELIAYHDTGAYERAVAAVASEAQAYVEARASLVTRPALVLDIDETSLSNWAALRANDFGYFTDGPCEALPRGPCGWHAWENSARGDVIAPVLGLYQAARARGVTVFFVTGRRENQRAGTEQNLRNAGYTEWGSVTLRPEGPSRPTVEYKSGARARIEAEGYTIIANVGDQPTDLAGGHAERTFLIPNPYYSVP